MAVIPSFDGLPLELKFKIVCELHIVDTVRLKCVSKQWREAVKMTRRENKSLALMAYPYKEVSEYHSIDAVVAKELGITRNDVLGWHWFNLNDNPKLVSNFLNAFQNLRAIEIDEISNKMLRIIDQRCPKLKGLCFHSLTKGDNGSELDFNNLPNLKQSLTKLAFGTEIERDVIKKAVHRDAFPNLEVIMAVCSPINVNVETYYKAVSLHTFTEVGGNLKRLLLSNRYILLEDYSSEIPGDEADQAVRESKLWNIDELECFGQIVCDDGTDAEKLKDRIRSLVNPSAKIKFCEYSQESEFRHIKSCVSDHPMIIG